MKELNRGLIPPVGQRAADLDQLKLQRRPFNAFFECLNRACISWMLALTAIGWLAGAAYAQQSSVDQKAPLSSQLSNGWWSPELMGFRVVPPHLELTMTNLNRFEAATSSGSATVVPSHYRLPENRVTNPASVDVSANSPADEFGSLAELQILHAQTFLPLFEAKYTAWEWSLAETRSLTIVNGVSVYPLIEINYAQWHAPVSLYIPLLRGSDTR